MEGLLPGGVTQHQIEAWKLKHGVDKVKAFDIPVNDEGTEIATGYFRKPDLQVIAISSKFIENDPIKAGLVLFENCWLGGDERITKDDELKMSAIESLNTMFRVRTATIKNL